MSTAPKKTPEAAAHDGFDAIAGALFGYRAALLAAGFPADETVNLVAQLQTLLLARFLVRPTSPVEEPAPAAAPVVSEAPIEF